jgi:site-specific DNA-cytosine methylase
MVYEWHEYCDAAKTLFKGQPLKVMDVACGAGGFSVGLESTGSFRSMWGIDIDVDAARAYEQNFPGATVFAEDVEVCAHVAMENLDRLTEHMENKPVLINTKLGEKHIPAAGMVDCMLIGTPW